MPAEITTAGFCPDYYSVFEVPSSDGKKVYRVWLDGLSGGCDCPGFKYRQECKHMKKVWDEACLYNPQWHDAGPGTLKPVERGDHCDQVMEPCPGCGEKMVPVRIAV